LRRAEQMRRKPLFYVFNMILPCLLITLVALLGFYIPNDSGEKVSMGITTLLSMTVFLMLVTESMPPTSDVLPLVGWLSQFGDRRRLRSRRYDVFERCACRSWRSTAKRRVVLLQCANKEQFLGVPRTAQPQLPSFRRTFSVSVDIQKWHILTVHTFVPFYSCADPDGTAKSAF